jgi:rod shape-determining protein MreD
MIGTILANLLRFVVLILLQALVVDHMDLAHGWLVPYPYVLCLLMLPLNTALWAALFIGFGTGMVMDHFSSTPGLHAGACTLMAYARHLALRALAPREGYEQGRRASITDMGPAWFMTYAGILVVIHHLWLFNMEVFRFSGFLATLLRALVSAAGTMVMVLLSQLLIARSGLRTR